MQQSQSDLFAVTEMFFKMQFPSLVTLLTISLVILVAPSTGNMEKKLVRELLKDYEKMALPMANSSATLDVKFSLTFIAFVINEQDQTLTLMTHENMEWTDYSLKWDPNSFGNLHTVIIHKDHLWTPDVTLHDPISDVDVEYGQGNVLVGHHGGVTLVRFSKAKVQCDFNSHHFPFDRVECSLKYGSWVYHDLKMNISLWHADMDLTLYQKNPTWELQTVKANRSTLIYACCPEPYSSIQYKIEFIRQDRHFAHVLLTPAFLLSILTILMYCLPSYNSDRIVLGVLLFCAFFVLLLYTSSLVPDWNHLPFFVIFLIVNLVLIAISTFLNSLLAQMANSKEGHQVPEILRTIMLKTLARVFCMKGVVKRLQSRHFVTSGDQSNLLPLNPSPSSEEDGAVVHPETSLTKDGKQSFEADVAFIRAFIRRCWQKAEISDRNENLRSEWKDVADVTNRLLFVIYQAIVQIVIGVTFIQMTE